MNEDQKNSVNRKDEGPGKMTPEAVEICGDMEWAVQDPEVVSKYPDEYVAVHRRQVIAHGHDLLTVLEEAQRITGLPKHLIALTTIMGPRIAFDPR